MPGLVTPEVDHFVPVGPSKEAINYVQLSTIDLSTFEDGPGARRDLAAQVHDAMITQGFFILVNHGISEEEVVRQTDIGHTIMNRSPQEEKQRLQASIRENGHYFGFKPRGVWKAPEGDQLEKIEQFNVYRDLTTREQPAALEPYRQEVHDFVAEAHKGVLYRLLRLFAIALEIEDEDYFVKLHDYGGVDASWLRYMKYHNSQSDAANLWLGGHRDLNCLTLLFSQPMTSLQVRDVNDNAEWKYVPHVPGALVINAGEIMQWFTGDYFTAAIHRVVEPPKDQQGHDRCSVFYFAVPNKDVVINTVLEQSPVLRRAGVQMSHKPEDAPTCEEWVTGRVKITGTGGKFDKQDGAAAVEKVGKVTTTWFR